MKSDERVQHVECDIDRFPIAEVSPAGDEPLEGFPLDELGDEIPVADAGPAGPEDLHHGGVAALPQGAALAADPLVADAVVAQLARRLLLLAIVPHPADLR